MANFCNGAGITNARDCQPRTVGSGSVRVTYVLAGSPTNTNPQANADQLTNNLNNNNVVGVGNVISISSTANGSTTTE